MFENDERMQRIVQRMLDVTTDLIANDEDAIAMMNEVVQFPSHIEDENSAEHLRYWELRSAQAAKILMLCAAAQL